jgi:hypothetical protein
MLFLGREQAGGLPQIVLSRLSRSTAASLVRLLLAAFSGWMPEYRIPRGGLDLTVPDAPGLPGDAGRRAGGPTRVGTSH